MNKEQIEYGKQQLEHIKEWFKGEETAPFMAITYEYFVNLIEWSEERLSLIEQVQELEGKLIEAKDDYDYLSHHYGNETEQNKRYQKTVQKIKSKISKQLEGLDAEEEIQRVMELSQLMSMIIEGLEEGG